MIKRTLFFTNPVYLNTENEQLVATYPHQQEKIPKAKRLKHFSENESSKAVPIEDIGVIILEHPQITITNRLIEKLINNNVAIIHCNQQHLPNGLFFPINGHSELSQRFHQQINASIPLKKNLWQQTVISKIKNQAKVLEFTGRNAAKLNHLTKEVNSGDTNNCEAQAAGYYWKNLFDIPDFYRQQKGPPPNQLLNYGYAIIRALTARALISSGLLPALGIFHKNKYNPYCLADDIMEPYRPFVDLIVWHIVQNENDFSTLTTSIKQQLLQVIAIDSIIENKKSPLMVAMSRTTNSLYECFAGISRKIIYPEPSI